MWLVGKVPRKNIYLSTQIKARHGSMHLQPHQGRQADAPSSPVYTTDELQVRRQSLSQK